MKFIPKQLEETEDISQGKRSKRNLISAAVGLILLVVIGYFALGLLGELIARSIPDAWERQMQTALPVPEKEQAEVSLTRAERILQKLINDDRFRELDYELFVFDYPVPNAVAVPGGGIGLTPKLLKSVESDTGLAFVIAHELGHHQNRDILKRMGRGLVFNAVSALLFNSSGLWSVNSVMRLAERGYSRSRERKADEFALRLVHERFSSLEGSLEFLKDVRKHRNEAAWKRYTRGHPLTRQRLEYLNALKQKLKSKD